jgi:hypothetical protein
MLTKLDLVGIYREFVFSVILFGCFLVAFTAWGIIYPPLLEVTDSSQSMILKNSMKLANKDGKISKSSENLSKITGDKKLLEENKLTKLQQLAKSKIDKAKYEVKQNKNNADALLDLILD